ncbi:MAG: hypothetical protein Q8L08_01040 [Candidatus Nanopelagicaceae bacterium]|nr:hypothetical protein [Candidatus Nanopelagicaceae bacterium]
MTFYQGSNGRTAVLFPGRFYTPNHPLLHYTREVLLAQGWSVEEVWWNPEDLVSDESVKRRVETVLNGVAGSASLVVGKSLGSLAMPSVIKRALPAIWLTPLFNRPELVAASKNIVAKTLLVGGTADDSWDGNIARASGQQVLELPGANHGLEIPGNPLASVGLLTELVATVTQFVGTL